MIKEKVDELVSNLLMELVSYEVDKTPTKKELINFYEKRKEELYEQLEAFVNSSYYAKLNQNGILERFIKTVISKSAAKKAILDYLLVNKSINTKSSLEPKAIKIFLEGFGLDFASILSDYKEINYIFEIFDQLFSTKGSADFMEILLRLYTGSNLIRLYNVNYLKNLFKDRESLLFYRVSDPNDRIILDYDLDSLLNNFNSWWHKTNPADASKNMYSLPVMGISVETSPRFSIYKRVRIFSDIILTILDKKPSEKVYVESLDVYFSVYELTLLYVSFIDIIYNKLWGKRPFKNLLYYRVFKSNPNKQHITFIETTKAVADILLSNTNLDSNTAFKIARLILDNYDSIKNFSEDELLAYISNRSLEYNVSASELSKISFWVEKLLGVIRYFEIIHAYYIQNKYEKIIDSLEIYFNKSTIISNHSDSPNSLLRLCYLENKNNLNIIDVINSIETYYNNNVLDDLDLVYFALELEQNILSYINKEVEIVNFLFPLFLILLNDPKYSESLFSFLEQIKPVHVKTFRLVMYYLYDINDRNIQYVGDDISLTQKITYTSLLNNDKNYNIIDEDRFGELMNLNVRSRNYPDIFIYHGSSNDELSEVFLGTNEIEEVEIRLDNVGNKFDSYMYVEYNDGKIDPEFRKGYDLAQFLIYIRDAKILKVER